MPTCAHCLLPVAEEVALRDDADGLPVVFCCGGCRAVHRLLRSEGLEQFYRRRRGWTPGPPEPFPLDADAFADSVAESPRGGSEATLAVSGIRCAACGWLIERYLGGKPGVLGVRMNTATGRVAIRWEPSRIDIAGIAGWIRDIGYAPLPDDAVGFEEAQKRERRDLLVRFGTAAFLSSQIMMYTAGLYAGYFQGIDAGTREAFKGIAVFLATPVLFYSGWPFLAGAVAGLRRRAAGMDLLVALGALSAYAYSVAALFTGDEVYVDTTAMIVTLILLGRTIEARARSSAVGALARLMRLLPRRAHRILRRTANDPPAVESVPLAALRPGDEVEVAAGEKVPVDGRVIDGNSEVDEAMLTGESRPVPKGPGSELFAGTVNGNCRLVIAATRTGRDTVLSQIVRAVEEAQSRKSPIQTAADRWAAAFVPAVLVTALLTLGFWLRAGSPAVAALLTAVSVLVIACPCALGLATPLAVFAGSLRAHEAGLLVRGNSVLEAAAGIDTVFLDKTGTVTEGRPCVTDIFGEGISTTEVVRIAASLEAPSEHPIGRVIVREAEERGIDPPPAAEWTSHRGHGVSGVVEGVRYLLGRASLLEAEGIVAVPAVGDRAAALALEGKTVVLLAGDGRVRGLLAAIDAPRTEAAEAVRMFREGGRQVALLSGDGVEAARRVAETAGIGQVAAPVDPMGKADIVRAARARGKRVLMVGDGVNDAPALAEADVGIAMGRGADIAASTAGAVLLRDDLRTIPAFLATARGTVRVIRQNLAWAFSYNLVAIPLAASGRLHPIVAAAFMTASSLLVVGNSLRLRKGRAS